MAVVTQMALRTHPSGKRAGEPPRYNFVIFKTLSLLRGFARITRSDGLGCNLF